MQVTMLVARVLRVFLEDPGVPRYGLDLMRETGLPSGSLYPILARMERAGWLRSRHEQIDPAAAGRPARRYYELTPDGLASARQELAALSDQLRPPVPRIGWIGAPEGGRA